MLSFKDQKPTPILYDDIVTLNFNFKIISYQLIRVCLILNYTVMELKKNKHRKSEKNRRLFFLFGLTISLSTVLLAFEWSTRDISISKLVVTTTLSGDEWDQAAVIREAEKVTPPVVQKPSPPILDIVPDTKEEITEAKSDQFNTEPVDSYTPTNVGRAEEPTEEIPKIYDWGQLNDKPEYPGGQKSLLEDIYDNLYFPQEALEIGIRGKVQISFVVAPNGEMTDFKIIRSVHPVIDNVALEAVKKIKKRWLPGKQMGKAVSVKMSVPIRFEIKE